MRERGERKKEVEVERETISNASFSRRRSVFPSLCALLFPESSQGSSIQRRSRSYEWRRDDAPKSSTARTTGGYELAVELIFEKQSTTSMRCVRCDVMNSDQNFWRNRKERREKKNKSNRSLRF